MVDHRVLLKLVLQSLQIAIRPPHIFLSLLLTGITTVMVIQIILCLSLIFHLRFTPLLIHRPLTLICNQALRRSLIISLPSPLPFSIPNLATFHISRSKYCYPNSFSHNSKFDKKNLAPDTHSGTLTMILWLKLVFLSFYNFSILYMICLELIFNIYNGYSVWRVFYNRNK